MSFHNTYHFVPLGGETPDSIEAPKPDEALTPEILRGRSFERYYPESLCGRIECRLTTAGPIVVGGQQRDHPDGYTLVAPFERDGNPAVPASTLRGCISSIAEAASNSALRVLDDEYYTRRVSFEEVGERVEDYSAMGMVVEKPDGLHLLPLAIPTLRRSSSGHYELPLRYRVMFPDKNVKLKAFVPGGAKKTLPPSYSGGLPKHYYAKIVGSAVMDSQFRITAEDAKEPAGKILLGATTSGVPTPTQSSADMKRGVLRVISTPDRREEMPPGKKHESFLPLDTRPDPPVFLILREALADFERLAGERAKENKRRATSGGDPLPFVSDGAEEFKDRDHPYRLQAGDIVFFVPDPSGCKVAKIWVSQIWREEIPGRTHAFFHSNAEKELLPFNPARKTISPAEAIFGFVEDLGERDGLSARERDEKARALASRVWFSDALLTQRPEDGCCESEIPLRILASPKPPCPSFYFRPRTPPAGDTPDKYYIAKPDLKPATHRPQGRKFYLNHLINEGLLDRSCKSWEDTRQNQKNQVRPLKKGCAFAFHVDFENLSSRELGLLLLALAPGPDFQHKIGMGKGLGLGSVEIEVMGVFYVDRRRRYTMNGLAEPRYRRWWVKDSSSASGGAGDHPFDVDERASIDAGSPIGSEDPSHPEALRESYLKSLPEGLRKIVDALQAVGKKGIPNVRPPLTADQVLEQERSGGDSRLRERWPEDKLFSWFQLNDHKDQPRESRQGLVPLDVSGGKLVALKDNHEPQRR